MCRRKSIPSEGKTCLKQLQRSQCQFQIVLLVEEARVATVSRELRRVTRSVLYFALIRVARCRYSLLREMLFSAIIEERGETSNERR